MAFALEFALMALMLMPIECLNVSDSVCQDDDQALTLIEKAEGRTSLTMCIQASDACGLREDVRQACQKTCGLCGNQTDILKRSSTLKTDVVCKQYSTSETECLKAHHGTTCGWLGGMNNVYESPLFVGCVSIEIANFFNESTVVCSGLPTEESCNLEIFDQCAWNEKTSECEKRGEPDPMIHYALLTFEAASEIETSSVEPHFYGLGNAGFNAAFRRATHCDIMTIEEHGSAVAREGIRSANLDGWSYIQLGPSSDTEFVSAHSNIAWNVSVSVTVSPRCRHTIPEPGDHDGCKKGQKIIITPTLIGPGNGSQASIAASVAKNGINVFSYWEDDDGITHCPVLVSWQPLVEMQDQDWRFFQIRVDESHNHLIVAVDGFRVATQPIEQQLYWKPSIMGYHPYGSYVGLLDLVSMSGVRPGTDLENFFLTILLNDVQCTVKYPQLTMTADGVKVASGQPSVKSTTAVRDNKLVFLPQKVPRAIRVASVSSEGVIELNADEPGEYSVQLAIQTKPDDSICSTTATLRVVVLPAIQTETQINGEIVSEVQQFATVGLTFVSSFDLVTSGGSAGLTFNATGLPLGIECDKTSGRLLGVPRQSGMFSVVYKIVDSTGGYRAHSGVFLHVAPPLSLRGGKATATEGAQFHGDAISLKGGRLFETGGYSFSLHEGSMLPMGIDVGDDGSLQGTPLQHGTFNVTIICKDANDGSLLLEQTVEVFPALKVQLEELQRVSVDQFDMAEVSLTYEVVGGLAPYRFSLVNAPLGMTISETGGTISGKPTATGTFAVALHVTDSNGATCSPEILELNVKPVSADQTYVMISVLTTVLSLVFGVTIWYQQRPRAVDFRALGRELIGEDDVLLPKEIHRSCIEQLEQLGEGAFGNVYKGCFRDKKNHSAPALVALKVLKENHSASERDDLLKEATVMAQLQDHENVCCLVGVVTVGDPEILIVQFAENGSLDVFLKTRAGIAELSVHAKLTICRDIAAGLDYIHNHNFVHCDLAARNVLLDSSYRCMVSDFGRARELDGEYYRPRNQSKIPVRWMAPEVLKDQKYSSASDIWSYGITIFEAFTKADTPYKNLSNNQVWIQVESGNRLECPEGCPQIVYLRLMKSCWKQDPQERPDAKWLLNEIDQIVPEETTNTRDFRTRRQEFSKTNSGSMDSSTPSVEPVTFTWSSEDHGSIKSSASTVYEDTVGRHLVADTVNFATGRGLTAIQD